MPFDDARLATLFIGMLLLRHITRHFREQRFADISALIPSYHIIVYGRIPAWGKCVIS